MESLSYASAYSFRSGRTSPAQEVNVCIFLRYDHYGERALPRIWKEACQKAGITSISLYAGVRHSFAMQRLYEGFSYEEVGACLGHSDVRITRRYGRLMAQDLAKVFSSSAKVVSIEEARRKKTSSSDS